MEEDDRPAVSARPGLVQTAHLLLLQGGHRICDVVHLDTDVMHVSRGVLVQEIIDGTVGPERVQ